MIVVQYKYAGYVPTIRTRDILHGPWRGPAWPFVAAKKETYPLLLTPIATLANMFLERISLGGNVSTQNTVIGRQTPRAVNDQWIKRATSLVQEISEIQDAMLKEINRIVSDFIQLRESVRKVLGIECGSHIDVMLEELRKMSKAIDDTR